MTTSQLIKSRDQYIAHSDKEVRKVRIFSHGAPLSETGLKSGGVSLTVGTMAFSMSWFQDVRSLCLDLGTRLNKRVEDLLTELYAGREMPPEAFELTLDDGL